MVRKMLIAAVGGIALYASAANAGTLAFSTAGSFNGGGSSLVIGDYTLSFTGASYFETDPTNSFTPVFGSFHLAPGYLGTPTPIPGGTTFTLDITQIFPFAPGGTQSSTTSVTGSISSSISGALLISFAPNPVIINTPGLGNSFYQIFQTSVPPGSTPAGNTVTLTGAVSIPAGSPSIVPLPASSMAGLGLLGAMSLMRMRRNRA